MRACCCWTCMRPSGWYGTPATRRAHWQVGRQQASAAPADASLCWRMCGASRALRFVAQEPALRLWPTCLQVSSLLYWLAPASGMHSRAQRRAK